MRACCSTFGPSASSRRTRPAATNSSSLCGFTKSARRAVPNGHGGLRRHTGRDGRLSDAALCYPVNEGNLVPALLQAIVNIDGEALVMHAGDKPYVVSPSGQVELASRGLTLDAVTGIVAQLLPVEFQNALDEFGAVQYTLPPQTEFPREQFTVVVARGGDDVWAEIRRKRVPDDDLVPEELFESSAPAAAVARAVVPPANV